MKMFSRKGVIELTISRFPASVKSVLNATCVINLYWVALIPALSDALMALNRDDATNGRVLVQFYAHPYQPANILTCIMTPGDCFLQLVNTKKKSCIQ